MLEFRLSPFGFESYKLYQGGQEVDGNYASVFASSDIALQQYNSARTLGTVGVVTMFVGTAALVAGAVILPIAYHDDDSTALGWALFGAGLGVDLIGAIFVGLGVERLNDAISLHNDALYERVRGAPQ